MYIADLHIHSHYARATSKASTPEHLDLWARRKGIGLVGTGDFTHPAWRQELRDKLEPTGNGLYVLKEAYRIRDNTAPENPRPHFTVTGEISSIYKKEGRVRKVHSLLLLPGLEEAERVSRRLEQIGNLHGDGRPILGLDCHDLLEILLALCPQAVYIPAHIWTPHFSLFGAFSGFDSVEACFGDLSPHIHAMETGLSSDPPMNWRVPALDPYRLISNSDAHSPAKLGREANLLDTELSYPGLQAALETGRGFLGTLEFFPQEGKYHYDGHRKCGLCLSPEETGRYGGVCPVCGQKLTVGVSHRVEQLAARPLGYRPAGAPVYESLVPLPELIAASLGCTAASARAAGLYQTLLQKLGPEFPILRALPLEDIRAVAGPLVAEGVRRLRAGQLTWSPGFDGMYGALRLFTPGERQTLQGQTALFQDSPNPAQPPRLPARPAPAPAQAAPVPPPPPPAPCWNEHQRQAITATQRAILVKAGPGTGKTGTLSAHILHLIETRRVSPAHITAVTFTNQAAGQLRARIQAQLGKGPAAKVQIGTFHALAHQRLLAGGTALPLAGPAETHALAEAVCRELSLSTPVSRLLTQISNEKSSLGPPGTFVEPPVLAAYQAGLESWGLLDFDDLLLKALQAAAGADAGVFPYLLVDEFQDVTPLQYRLIRAWNQGGRELFVIGDPDQAIYGFRGADAGCFQKLAGDFPGALTVTLTENYRSSPQILSLATQAIAPNPGGERLLRPHCPAGPPVRVVEAPSPLAEAIFLAKEIGRLTGGVGMLEAHAQPAVPGGPWGFEDIAILYRTHRQAALLEECLQKEGIPYQVAGREPFLQEKAVRAAACFFRSLLSPADGLAAHTARLLLWGGSPTGQAETAYAALAEQFRPRLKTKSPQVLLEQWAGEMGLAEDPGLEKLCQMAAFYRRMPAFLEALETGVESDLRRCNGKRYTAAAVTLMTLHGAKGLEFPVVLLYGVRAGLIPFAGGQPPASQQEERRLFYVGLTRAKQALLLTTSPQPSPFLQALPAGACTQQKAPQPIPTPRQTTLFDLL
ncbi:UvrD-helicase domain-containing protein [Acutalibacter caecimuris]|uniref:UvrD-helicase domain-containing protein n=1 Tax=Acutalibacter caecimuris TaxID=3093657 RepID=UPI002AC90E49|nr:UvrD-helicase domain-containing protein [Acutalibacter sp. M00118]